MPTSDPIHSTDFVVVSSSLHACLMRFAVTYSFSVLPVSSWNSFDK